MSAHARYLLYSTLCGSVWGVIAGIIAGPFFGRITWGGVLLSPVIGLFIGLATARCVFLRPLMRALLALVVLYGAAALFGLGMGLFDAFVVGVENRAASGVVGQAILAVLWGLTFLGWFLALGPLAYATLALLARHSPANPLVADGRPALTRAS